MPETDPVRDRHKAGDFADTSIESVRQYLGEHKNVTCVQGFVPDTLGIIRERAFSFVHVDLDIYQPIKAACEFFYPRMQKGGIMLFDDYGYPSCPGARMAVDEHDGFFNRSMLSTKELTFRPAFMTPIATVEA